MKDKEDFCIYIFLILSTINFTIFKSFKLNNFLYNSFYIISYYKELFNSFFLYLY